MCNFATCTIIVPHCISNREWEEYNYSTETREAWCLLGRFNRLRSKVSNCASLVARWLPSNPSSTCHTALSSSIQSPLNWRDLWCPHWPTIAGVTSYGEEWCGGGSGGSNYHHTHQIWLFKPAADMSSFSNCSYIQMPSCQITLIPASLAVL